MGLAGGWWRAGRRQSAPVGPARELGTRSRRSNDQLSCRAGFVGRAGGLTGTLSMRVCLERERDIKVSPTQARRAQKVGGWNGIRATPLRANSLQIRRSGITINVICARRPAARRRPTRCSSATNANERERKFAGSRSRGRPLATCVDTPAGRPGRSFLVSPDSHLEPRASSLECNSAALAATHTHTQTALCPLVGRANHLARSGRPAFGRAKNEKSCNIGAQ